LEFRGVELGQKRKKEVEKLWEGIKNNYCKKLESMVKEKGVKGVIDITKRKK